MTGALAGMGIRRPAILACRCRCRIRAIDTITPPVSIPAANTAIGGSGSCWVIGGGLAAARLAGRFCPAGLAAGGPAGADDPAGPGDPAWLAAGCGRLK